MAEIKYDVVVTLVWEDTKTNKGVLKCESKEIFFHAHHSDTFNNFIYSALKRIAQEQKCDGLEIHIQRHPIFTEPLLKELMKDKCTSRIVEFYPDADRKRFIL